MGYVFEMQAISSQRRCFSLGTRWCLCLCLLVAGCDLFATGEETPEESTVRTGRGATQSITVLAEESVSALNSQFATLGIPAGAFFPVTSYKIVYETIDAEGDVTVASGALLVPQTGLFKIPLLNYQHGTASVRDDVPSANSPERIIGMAFASQGYLVAMPDLLGLGDSPGLHPYLHAATSATAVVDMLRATTDFVAAEEVPWNNQLFIAGYSQGGYTAMAAHRALETEYQDEFEVTASAPMAGPYDLSGVMAERMIAIEPHPSPYYLPYTLLAYNSIYRLYDSPSRFLKSPYDTQIPPLFDGRHTGGQINALLPDIPRDMLTPEIVSAFENNPDHPLRLRLKENDVYDWAPQAPVRLFHCEGDQHVPAENSRVALRQMQSNGARIELIEPLTGGDHSTCVIPSLLRAKLWFDSL